VRTNTVKTVVLLSGLAGALVLVGQLLGGLGGAVVGLLLGLALVGGSYWWSDRMALRAAGATLIGEGEAPRLHAAVRELAGRAGMAMPRIAISPSPQPNAFATGRDQRHAVVCVTQGLLDRLPPEEVRGVLAHELAHVRNRDILIGSIAAAIATGISFIANMAMFAGMFGGDDDDAPNPLALLLLAVLAPVSATLMQLSLSRSREFEADRMGAEILGDPAPLARALARLEVEARRTPMHVDPAHATAYIVNPLTGRQVRFAHLFLTHPPTEDRIERLVGRTVDELAG